MFLSFFFFFDILLEKKTSLLIWQQKCHEFIFEQKNKIKSSKKLWFKSDFFNLFFYFILFFTVSHTMFSWIFYLNPCETWKENVNVFFFLCFWGGFLFWRKKKLPPAFCLSSWMWVFFFSPFFFCRKIIQKKIPPELIPF